MKHPVVVRWLAETHLFAAYAWYEKQVPGLGADFLCCFQEVLERIAEHPSTGRVVFLDYRRLLLRRFPYGVFYVVEDGAVVVAAVYHLARNPATIRKSLKP